MSSASAGDVAMTEATASANATRPRRIASTLPCARDPPAPLSRCHLVAHRVRVAPMGLGLSLRVLAEMARVTAPSVMDIARGRLSRETVDDRARAFARRTLEVLEMQLSVERLTDLDETRGYVYLF